MKTHDLSPFLSEHPFFKDLVPEYIEFLAGCAKNVRFDEGESPFKLGDPANEFFLIRSGKVALDVVVSRGRRVTIATLGDGDVLGWSWLVPPHTWAFDVRAVTLTRAISMDGTCLRKKCEEDPKLGYEMMKRFSHVMAARLRATRLQLVDMCGTPGERAR